LTVRIDRGIKARKREEARREEGVRDEKILVERGCGNGILNPIFGRRGEGQNSGEGGGETPRWPSASRSRFGVIGGLATGAVPFGRRK
jgi:hypothetical protein